MTLKQLIKNKFKTVKEFLRINSEWSEDSTRVLMSKGSEVKQLANGDYILTNKFNKVIKCTKT